MESLANSRKLNGISLVECLQNEVTDKDNQAFSSLVRPPKIDQSFAKKYQQPNTTTNNHSDSNINPVSKSLKSFFNKLRGNSATTTAATSEAVSAQQEANDFRVHHANIILNNNKSSLQLLKPTTPSQAKHTTNAALTDKRILIPASYSNTKSYSKYNNNYYYNKSSLTRPKKKKMMMVSPLFTATTATSTKKNYRLPAITTTSTKSTTPAAAINNYELYQEQQYRRSVSLPCSSSSSAHIYQPNRHTLDLGCYTTTTPASAFATFNSISDKNDTKLEMPPPPPTLTKRRANSLSCSKNNNNSSIYSTFTSSTSSASSSSNTKASTTCSSSCSVKSCSSSSFGLKRKSNTIQNITELLLNRDTLKEEEDNDFILQKRLWNEDITFCQKEEIAQWLGSKPVLRSRILYLYMNNFNFSSKRLDEAFRILCLKLYLKGETQQLDRIIEAFAKRYFECNPTTLLHCVDVVYAVAYSLLLLNTDLHVADTKNGEKMTKTKFIKNTMDTIQSLMFPHLKGDEATDFTLQRKRRASTLSHQSCSNNSIMSINPSSSQPPPTFEENNTMINKLDALKSNISWKTASSGNNNDISGLTKAQKTWLAGIESLLKEMYTAVKSHSIDQAAATTKAPPPASNTNDSNSIITTVNSSGLYRSRTLPKEITASNNDTFHSRRRRRGHSALLATSPTSTKNTLLQQQPLLSSSSLSSSNTNFKEGLVMRKHVMESADKRARHRQWQLCYLVMNQSKLIMYKPTHLSAEQREDSQQQERRGRRRRKRNSLMLWNQSVCSLQDILSKGIVEIEDWKADKEKSPLNIIEMNHTYASVIPPPGWNGQRPHVFRLETADGGLWLFESIDVFAIQAWVEAANLTAAKISRGPLTGAVCNIDYGWGSKWNNNNNNVRGGRKDDSHQIIPVWHPPTPCMIKNNASLNDQYHDLESQINHLKQQLYDHRQLKLSLDKKFNSNACPYSGGGGNTLNSMQALKNWDRKLHYILHELIKLRCYKDSLQSKLVTM